MKHDNRFEAVNRLAAENTSKALTKLTGVATTVAMTRVEVKPVSALSTVLDLEELVVGIFLPITGDRRGISLLVFPKEASVTICDRLLRPRGTTRSLSELDHSALQEVGNILVGTYLTVLANALQIKLVESIPSLSRDMFGAIVDHAISEVAARVEQMLVVEVRFSMEGMSVEERLVLVLAIEGLDAIVRSLETAT